MRLVEKRSAESGFFSQIERCWWDLKEALLNWRTWYYMGIAEVRQRYRRSVIGPIWVSLTMAVQALVMGYLLSMLFNQEANRFMPFVCISLIVWNYFSSSINEGAMCFISMSGIILQVRRSLWTYILLILWRNAIIFLHTIPVFLLVALAFGIYPRFNYFLIPFGVSLFLLNVAWMSCLAGVLSARFHDIPQIILNAMNVIIWLTPVYYNQNQLGHNAKTLISLNPLTSMIEVVRGPFLNETPSAFNWLICIIFAVFGWGITFLVFSKYRSRIAFWI